MEKLFNDNEFVTSERPNFITDEQKEQMYRDIAQEIINEGYIEFNEDIEDIVSDLKSVNFNQSGYEIAKDLEFMGCSYVFDSDFIGFLSDLEFKEDEFKNENVKAWVKAYNPQPKLKEGAKIEITNKFAWSFNIGDVRYINGYDKKMARYKVSVEYPCDRSTLIAYEVIEQNSQIIG